MNNHIIDIQHVSKQFSDQIALHDISLQIQDREFITLLGPSGCGKTTLLRLLAGFSSPDSGQILLQNKRVNQVAPEQRNINMVFQNYALFPHMNVFDNVAFGLRCKRVSHSDIKERVMSSLEMVHMAEFSQRKPHQLSGGQQQRVAIARAVVNRPLVLLLDEPLSALDNNLTKKMQIELKQLQRQLGITFILVTHNQEEALSMSDRIVVMNQGRIEQVGRPRDVYEEPKNIFVAKFVGETNIFNATVESITDTHLNTTIEDKPARFANPQQFKVNDKLLIIFRPEDIQVIHRRMQADYDDKALLPGIVENVIYKGVTVDLMIKLDSGRIISTTQFFNEDDAELQYRVGEEIYLYWHDGWEVILADE